MGSLSDRGGDTKMGVVAGGELWGYTDFRRGSGGWEVSWTETMIGREKGPEEGGAQRGGAGDTLRERSGYVIVRWVSIREVRVLYR